MTIGGYTNHWHNQASATAFIVTSALIAIVFAFYLFLRVQRIKLDFASWGNTKIADAEEAVKLNEETGKTLLNIYDAVRQGADSFLFAEYRICLVFVALFGVVIIVLVSHVGSKDPLATENGFRWDIGGFALIAFLVGALCSIFSGYIGMKVAVFSNIRTCISAIPDGAPGWQGAFSTAMNAGGVMGFSLCGLSLVVLYSLCSLFAFHFGAENIVHTKHLFEAIAGFGLGGSSIAMFGRVGGGIFTKAADVGADLAGKVVQNIPEDDPRNPGTIADNVGDNVGDVAGMGSDLFGSFAEASCAALIVGGTSFELVKAGWGALMFPLHISAAGILVGVFTHFVATDFWPVKSEAGVLRALKVQIGVSTILATAVVWPIIVGFMPYSFSVGGSPVIVNGSYVMEPGQTLSIEDGGIPVIVGGIHGSHIKLFFAVCVGLWGGCIIGFVTEYFTSYAYQPTQEVARSTETGAATNIIYGLALGYKSAVIPILVLSVDVFVSFHLLGMYGVALCALGMLMTLSSCLTIDVYGPICDNAGGFAEMSGLPHSVRDKTDALDAAGNTTAAIGKGFAIGSAALTSLALIGAFVTRVSSEGVTLCGGGIDILQPITFASLITGAMIPYWFSAMTMKSVGKAAMEMVKEVARQFREIPGLLEGTPGHGAPEHGKCIQIATDASLKEMILPGALVIIAPLFCGILFGVNSVVGLLAGGLSSGVQLAVSMSNTGGAWDNAKKFVEKGGLSFIVNGESVVQKKGSDAHKAAVIGDTVGDPFKDTSGPAINIVMKLMAIISLVFADFFVSIRNGGGAFHIIPSWIASNRNAHGHHLKDAGSVTAFVLIASFTGIFFALFLFMRVRRIKLVVNLGSNDYGTSSGVALASPKRSLLAGHEEEGEPARADVGQTLIKIYDAVRQGADAFLMAEYRICAIFLAVFALVILILVSHVGKGYPKANAGGFRWDVGGFACLAFLIGGATSILSGWIGMKVAVYSNVRTCISAIPDGAPGWRGAFSTAMNAGGVMGFSLCGISMLVLYSMCCLFATKFNSVPASFGAPTDVQSLFEAIAGFGLGGSSIAMFGRVGGGIFTKAADVGADLAGKVVQNIPEDDPRNPGTIADNVGDNVGDVAGMGSDLFGSFAEASCAALIVGGTSPDIVSAGWGALMFPITISAGGLFVCLLTHFVATDIWPVTSEAGVLRALKVQIGVSTVLATAVLYPVIALFLPAKFHLSDGAHSRVQVFFSVAVGLWGGCLIGFVTEYFTSYDYQPTQEVARSTETGAATNIIYGLALGYKSAIIPITILSIDIFISFKLCGMYGVALCALGMLMTLSSCLTIDVYGPICDNAGGFAEMSGLPHGVRDKTDALDAAGNTTAAIGKGFAIGSAALTSLALFGAFVTRVQLSPSYSCFNSGSTGVNILDPITFASLVMGAMIPYWFSAMTMKSVGKAAMEMVKEVARQFREIPGLLEGTPGHGAPEHGKCIQIATDASLKEMLPPGALVILTPIVFGIFFGVNSVFGLLAGSMSSGVQLAVSMSNTGGAWDNAKKFVEKGGLSLKVNGEMVVQKKGSDAHKAAVIGDTVGDPLKDTSGPAINIVMKLMAIISLVFADFFVSIRNGEGAFGIKATCK